MKEGLTPYSELDIVLSDLGSKIQNVLGDNFVGMYLQGSLAIGDFDMTSDVDFIVVTNEDLKEEQVKAVQEAHTATYSQSHRWAKRLEYSFFPKPLLNIQSSPFNEDGVHQDSEDRKIWYFDHGSPTIEKSDHCNTLVTRWTVREKGVTVIGPDPKTLINPVDPNDLRREIKSTLMGWARELENNPEQYRNRFYQAYLVLNHARMLQDLYEGRITSKLEGINWAKEKLDPRWTELIDYCWQQRQDPDISINQPTDPERYKQSIEFVKYIVEQGRNFQIA